MIPIQLMSYNLFPTDKVTLYIRTTIKKLSWKNKFTHLFLQSDLNRLQKRYRFQQGDFELILTLNNTFHTVVNKKTTVSTS